MSDDDTYPSELYIDEVDVYDYEADIWAELLELQEWESEQSDHDAWFWNEE